MSQTNLPPEQDKGKQIANSLAVYSVGGQVGCATLIIVIVAVFAGIGLDRLFSTKPVFTILLTLGSAPIALFITYKLAMRAVKTINPQVPEAGKTAAVKEEEERE